MQLADVTLDDKYTLDSGRVYLNGIQALTRLLMMQRLRDAAAGLNTAGFVSGFQGSPLNNMDKTLWEAHDLLARHHVHFQPGQNEELAAMGVWGAQQVALAVVLLERLRRDAATCSCTATRRARRATAAC